MAIPHETLNKSQFLKASPFVYMCRDPKTSPVIKNALLSRPIQQFNELHSPYLPLPIKELENMYEAAHIEPSTDWFFNNVIIPIQNKTYSPKHEMHEICDARPTVKDFHVKYVIPSLVIVLSPFVLTFLLLFGLKWCIGALCRMANT